MAKKKGRVHKAFQKRIQQLRESAAKNAAALRGEGVHDWQLPTELAEKSLTDVPGLHEPAHNRDPINENYEECLADSKNPGTGGDLQGLKAQIDFMAAEEQALREQCCGIVRSFVHGHARLYGQGKQESVFDAVGKQAADFIAAGAGTIAQDTGAGNSRTAMFGTIA